MYNRVIFFIALKRYLKIRMKEKKKLKMKKRKEKKILILQILKLHSYILKQKYILTFKHLRKKYKHEINK